MHRRYQRFNRWPSVDQFQTLQIQSTIHRCLHRRYLFKQSVQPTLVGFAGLCCLFLPYPPVGPSCQSLTPFLPPHPNHRHLSRAPPTVRRRASPPPLCIQAPPLTPSRRASARATEHPCCLHHRPSMLHATAVPHARRPRTTTTLPLCHLPSSTPPLCHVSLAVPARAARSSSLPPPPCIATPSRCLTDCLLGTFFVGQW